MKSIWPETNTTLRSGVEQNFADVGLNAKYQVQVSASAGSDA
jgi:hypothetical protein